MMKRLNHNTRVLVTDGGKAMVFRNMGQVGSPNLEFVKGYGQDVPPNRELATDKPARVQESVGNRRSSGKQTDYHQQAEDRFVEQIASDMAADLRAGEFEELVNDRPAGGAQRARP